MSAPIIRRNDAGQVVAVQTEHVIAKRTSTGQLVWRTCLPKDGALPSLGTLYEEAHELLNVIDPDLAGRNLIHGPPDKHTGYRVVKAIGEPPSPTTSEAVAIVNGLREAWQKTYGSHVPSSPVLYDGRRCDDCNGPLVDLGAQGDGCSACAALEDDALDYVAPARPTPMLPRPIDMSKPIMKIGGVPICNITAATFATLAGMQADEMRHDMKHATKETA